MAHIDPDTEVHNQFEDGAKAVMTIEKKGVEIMRFKDLSGKYYDEFWVDIDLTLPYWEILAELRRLRREKDTSLVWLMTGKTATDATGIVPALIM